jgi:hypothetical protein
MLQHDADGSWQTWQHGDASNSWKTPAAMLQHDADGSWQTWQHGDASNSQTAWHADGANWHHATACMSQTVQSDGWSAILGCILCIFKFLPLYFLYSSHLAKVYILCSGQQTSENVF